MSLLEAYTNNDDNFGLNLAEVTGNYSLLDARKFFSLNSNYQITSKSNRDELLDSDYNLFTKYFKVIKPHIQSNSNNNETLNYLTGIKQEKDKMREENISSSEKKLKNLTDGIKKFQQEEKQVWLNLRSTEDPNFMEKRQIYLIREKINDLVEQRKQVFGDLETKYNNLSDKSNNLLRLKYRSKFLNTLQHDITDENNDIISNMDSDILTRRRQIQINNYQYQKHLNFIFYLKVFFIFSLLALIPCILALNDLPFSDRNQKGPFVTITIGILFVIGAAIIITRVIKNSHRSKFIWPEKHFIGLPSKKAGKRECN